jgi:hypothetical protein
MHNIALIIPDFTDSCYSCVDLLCQYISIPLFQNLTTQHLLTLLRQSSSNVIISFSSLAICQHKFIMFLDEQKTHAIMRYSSDSTSKKKVDSRTSKTTKNGKKKIAKAEAKESNELIMKLIESNGPFG